MEKAEKIMNAISQIPEHHILKGEFNGKKVGECYWIFDGSMKPIKDVLTSFVNGGRTAMFGGIPRRTKNVYNSKEQAIKIGRY